MPNIIIFFSVPFFTALLALFIHSRLLASLLSLIPLGLLFFADFTPYDAVWLKNSSIHFTLQIDALSRLFLYIVCLIVPFCIASTPKFYEKKNVLFSLIFLVQGFVMGFFMTSDLIFFVMFWEAMLIPVYFMILGWGKEHKKEAAFTFIIYMIAGSIFLVAAIFAIYSEINTFNIFSIKSLENSPYAFAIFSIFILAFAVKVPLFPFHAWLPKAYTQAPIPATLLLSAVLSKAGIYGLFRIGVQIFPNFLQSSSIILVFLALIGVIYGGLVAWMQIDFKKLFAYSSFSHVNFILVGVFILNTQAQNGALIQSFNHSITITALFLAAWWLELRLNNTLMEKVSGLAQYFPKLCWLTLFFILSSIALPGLNNFIGELFILFGIFKINVGLTVLLGLSIILAAIYMLNFMQKIYFGSPRINKENIFDIQNKQLFLASILVFFILWVGIFPAPIIELSSKAYKEISGK